MSRDDLATCPRYSLEISGLGHDENQVHAIGANPTQHQIQIWLLGGTLACCILPTYVVCSHCGMRD